MSSSTPCHSASIRRLLSISGRFKTLIQSVLWIVIPRPLVTKPTISSPGTGLQHLENRTARSWIPFTIMPLFDLLPLIGTTAGLLLSPMASRIVASVTSRFSFFVRSSIILLMTCPSFNPPCPTDARTESQS